MTALYTCIILYVQAWFILMMYTQAQWYWAVTTTRSCAELVHCLVMHGEQRLYTLSHNTVCSLYCLLLLWIATVIIENFAKPSGSDHVNDVRLIPEPQYKNTVSIIYSAYVWVCVQQFLLHKWMHHTTTLPCQQKGRPQFGVASPH